MTARLAPAGSRRSGPQRGGMLTAVVVLVAASAGAVITPAGVAHAASRSPHYIVNGKPATISQFPYYAAVLDTRRGGTRYTQFICGGSVVAPRLVLTAGHCTFDDLQTAQPTPDGVLDVLVGSGNLGNSSGHRIPVTSIERYPTYDPSESDSGDLALLTLAANAGVTPVSVVPSQSDYRWDLGGVPATVAGLGCQTATPAGTDCVQYPLQLRQASLTVQPTSYCSTHFTSFGLPYDTHAMLCAGTPSSTNSSPDPCFGDSGGPLVVPGLRSAPLLIGLVSWGIVCGGQPTVFTRLAGYRSWLHSEGVPIMPAAFAGRPAVTYTAGAVPIAGDFNGDGFGDAILYRPGTASDPELLGTANGFRAGPSADIRGTYRTAACNVNPSQAPVKATDLILHGPGSAPDYVILGRASGLFAGGPPLTIRGDYDPLAGDFNGDGICDLLLYAPGTASDWLLLGRGDGTFRGGAPVAINGNYRPLVGDFNGDHRDDILWYQLGPAPDYLWFGRATGFVTGWPVAVNGWYWPVVGDFDGDHHSDILWYQPGTGADVLWRGRTAGFYDDNDVSANGTYLPVSADFDGDHRDDILWYMPGTGLTLTWFGR